MIPEILIHRAIVGGIRAVRQDPRIIDNLFKHVPRAEVDRIRTFVLENTLSFHVNYPRGDLKIPSLVLLLKTEEEAETFLGDQMGVSGHFNTPDTDISYDTYDAEDALLGGGHAGTVSTTSGLPRRLAGPLPVAAGTASGITFTDDDAKDTLAALISENPGCTNLYVVGGTGEGQVYTILRISSDSIDIDGTFVTQLDSTSFVDIREATAVGLAVGEPSQVYDSGARNLNRIGANFSTSYQLEVLAAKQEEVLYLYSIVKAILFSQKVFLEEQGIMALQISGSDFAPRSEFGPTEVYQRVLNLQFKYPFSFLKEFEVADNIVVKLTPDDCETNCETITLGTIEIE